MSDEKMTHRMTKSLYLRVSGSLQEVKAGTLIGPKLGAEMAKAGYAISLADEAKLVDEAEKGGKTPPPPPGK